MTTYVKTDYVPSTAKFYLSEGTEYEVKNASGYNYINGDNGNASFINVTNECHHLEGRKWTVINR